MKYTLDRVQHSLESQRMTQQLQHRTTKKKELLGLTAETAQHISESCRLHFDFKDKSPERSIVS